MLTIPLSLLELHFVGDFLLQSDWMALNKSKHWDPLVLHTLIYSICFLHWGWTFVGVTFVTHTLTDALTSRLTAYLWNRQERHWFFVVIGLDQLIHYMTLSITYAVLVSRHLGALP